MGSSYSAGLLFSLAGFAVIGSVTLLTSVLSARLFGIVLVGQAALALAPVAIVTLLSTVREQPAMVRELAKLKPRHPRVSGIVLAVFVFSFALTALVSALAMLCSYLLLTGPLHEPGLFWPASAGLLGYLLIVNTCWNMDGVFGAFRAGRELFAVRLNQAVSYGLLVAVLASALPNIWGLVLAFIGSWMTALVHRVILFRRVVRLRVPRSEIAAGFQSLREIVGFGLRMTPGFLGTGLSESSGPWILGLTGSISAVGAYSRAWNFAARLVEVNWRITEMLLPTLVQHRHAQDTQAFERVLVDSLRYAAFGMLLPAAVAGGAAHALMSVFGEGFDSAAMALRLLLFVPVFQTLTAIQGAALVAHGRPLLTALAQAGRLIVTLGGGIALSLAYGVTGMALGMTLGILVSFAVYVAILKIRLGTSMPSLLGARQLSGFAAAYVCAFTAAFGLERAIGGVSGLLAALAAGTLAYVVVGVGVSGTTPADRDRLRRAVRRISRRTGTPLGVSASA